MHKTFISVLLVLTTSTLVGQVLISDEQSTVIDQYIESEMKDRQIPGLALAIAYKGEIIKQKAFGLADIQNQAPVTTNTVFELASITKQFTASAIMILVQEGKVDLEADIHTYLADAPAHWQGVKVRHLLSHTSGLPVLGRGFSGYAKMNSQQLLRLLGANFPADLVYEAARADSLEFEPGDKHQYSDVGFFLLGLIIQEVSDKSYREFMQERIFDPVGMEATYIVDQVTIHPNEARGYTIRDGELVNIRRIWEFEVPSHYGIFSTVGDLIKWDAVLYTEDILTDESKEKMWSMTRRNNGLDYPYGFAWSVWERDDKKIIDHTGVTGTQITRYLSDSITVVVLTNLGRRWGNNLNVWGLTTKIGEMLGHDPFITQGYQTLSGATIKKVKSKKLKNVEGVYAIGMSERRLYVEEDKLFYDRGNSRSEMAPLSNDRYLMLGTVEEWILEPVEGSDGKEWQWLLNEQPAGRMRYQEPLKQQGK